MTGNFAEHSANERTFLAWIRTAIAVIAFGFVLEKFNLFIVALAASSSAEVSNQKLIEGAEPRQPGGIKAEIAVSAILVALVVVYCASILVG